MIHLVDDWHNLYGEGWKNEITPDAFTHPAKFSRALIRNIYQHCAADGWIKPGDRVLDCFGGVALGSLDAMRLGLHWTGLELEQKFVDLGNANIALWNKRYGSAFRVWGSARLSQGDSRKLLSMIDSQQTAAMISSPPFNGSNLTTDSNFMNKVAADKRNGSRLQPGIGEYGKSDGQIDNMPDGDFSQVVSSPPFLQTSGGTNVTSTQGPLADGRLIQRHAAGNAAAGYGDSEGLSDLPAGDFDQVVSSPPYIDSMERKGGIDPSKSNHVGGPHSQMNRSDTRYGESDGQLGSAPAGDFEQVVSSPPYEGLQLAGGGGIANEVRHIYREGKNYGDELSQVGSMSGDTFWSASKLIVEQCYLALASNGHACWVVKDYVRGGQRIPFCDMWRQLCESVGFVTLHEHHAWVVEDNGTQAAFDGNDKSHKKSRKSFFRRLAESKGSPEINWETVYCMVKP